MLVFSWPHIIVSELDTSTNAVSKARVLRVAFGPDDGTYSPS